jgi:hypothetical protein
MMTSLSCFGGSNAAVTINPTGGTSPYTFLWSNNATTQNLSNLSAGTYNLTITDSRSCTYVYPGGFTISNPPQMTGSVGTKTDVKCFGSGFRYCPLLLSTAVRVIKTTLAQGF